MYTVKLLLCALRLFLCYKCAIPRLLLYNPGPMLCPRAMLFRINLYPQCMRLTTRGNVDSEKQHMQISPALFHPLGIHLTLTSRRPCPFHSFVLAQ